MSARSTAFTRARTRRGLPRRRSSTSTRTNASIAAPASRPAPWPPSSRKKRLRRSGRASFSSTTITGRSSSAKSTVAPGEGGSMRRGMRVSVAGFWVLTLAAMVAAASGCSAGKEKAPEPPPYVPEVLPVAPPPPGFEPMLEPPDNPTTPEKAALGRQLFFDKRLSVDGSKSCYSCHVNEHGLTDGLPVAIAAGGKKLTRSSPTLWNIGYHKEFYWDGRSASLEKQAGAAWAGPNMGAKDKQTEIVAAINAIPGYHAQFQKVFGSDASADNIPKAIAAYERTIVCGDTAWDKFQQGDASALSDEAKRGWELFRGKAGCGT